MNRFPPLFRLCLALTLFDLVIFGLFRVIFYQWFAVPDTTITAAMLLNAFYLGLKFDLKLALLISLPIFLLGLSWTFNEIKKGIFRQVVLTYLLLAHALILFVYFIDFGHYDYLRLRVDVTVLRFLEDLAISRQMVHESYPVARSSQPMSCCCWY